MTLFWKATAGALICVVLTLAIGKQEKDMALMLAMLASVMISMSAFSFLEPVLEFFYRLEAMGDLQSGVLGVLLKITGIGLVSEVAGLILADSGNCALARGMQLLGTAVILSYSLPILETLLELIQEILGTL